MSIDKKVYGALRKYTDEKVKLIQTGNVAVEKTSDGVVFIAHKGEATETRAEFTKDELRAIGVQSFDKDEDGYIIVTYTDGSTQNIGQLNGKNAAVEVVADTNLKYILKFSYYDKDDNLIEITTPNLRQNKVEIVPNTSNTENSYKLDINTYDAEGNKTTVTSDELMAEKYEISPNVTNNKYDYRLNLEKTKNDGTKEIKTTANLKGNEIWIGTDLIGNEIVFEVLADDGKSYSRINDLYINSDTNDIYRRSDKDNINNVWEKVGNIRGLQGDDAYEVAVKEGYVGTRQEWLLTLVGQSALVKRVWEIPKIEDESTELQVWYYYQVDSLGENTAWKYDTEVKPVKDYPVGKYSFFSGTKFYNLESTKLIPALSEKDNKVFMVRFDERNLTAQSWYFDINTKEEFHGGEIPVTISPEKPEDSELVSVNFLPLGKWVQTMYIGSTKNNCDVVTLETGSSLDGLITSDQFFLEIGNEQLKTDKKDVKGSINEIFDMIKTNKNPVLETTNKSLFEAVNELYKKKNIDCYELKDEDLLAHCLSENYKILSCNLIYAENCTNVPKGSSGYGCAMLIIDQDTHCRQVMFFDSDNRKISVNSISSNATNTDFGNWSGWNYELTSNDITTTINSSSTNDQVPSALSVKTELDNKLDKTYVPIISSSEPTNKVVGSIWIV